MCSECVPCVLTLMLCSADRGGRPAESGVLGALSVFSVCFVCSDWYYVADRGGRVAESGVPGSMCVVSVF